MGSIKTAAKRKKQEAVTDLSTGPEEPESTGLPIEGEAIVAAFRRHTLLLPGDRALPAPAAL